MSKKIATIFVFLCFLSTGCAKEESIPAFSQFTPEPMSQSTVALMAAGDNLIHSPIYKQAKSRADAGYDFSPLYSNVKNIVKSHDISIINQETPLGGEELGISSYPMFNSPQELGYDLVDAGFNVINHANNHIMDAGTKGVENTLSFWKSLNIPVIGAYEKDDKRIKYIQKNGLTFALLAYTYGTNGIRVSQDSTFVISMMDKQMIESDVTNAKQTADAVILNMHWGDEYKMLPNNKQKDFAEFAASLNVDLLIGHHPHVIQPIESIKRADNNDMYVAYSLGNFVSCQNEAETMLGGMLSAEFIGSKGNVKINDIKFIPIITHYENNYSNVKIYLFENYTSGLANTHGCRTFDSNFSYNYIKNILSSTINDEYLLIKD